MVFPVLPVHAQHCTPGSCSIWLHPAFAIRTQQMLSFEDQGRTDAHRIYGGNVCGTTRGICTLACAGPENPHAPVRAFSPADPFAGHLLMRPVEIQNPAFRARNLQATLLLAAGVIVMIGRVPLGNLLTSNWAGKIQAWIMQGPSLAGQRGIIIGVALGLDATGLRIILGIDRPYLE